MSWNDHAVMWAETRDEMKVEIFTGRNSRQLNLQWKESLFSNCFPTQAAVDFINTDMDVE